jgi:hypothetical protein
VRTLRILLLRFLLGLGEEERYGPWLDQVKRGTLRPLAVELRRAIQCLQLELEIDILLWSLPLLSHLLPRWRWRVLLLIHLDMEHPDVSTFFFTQTWDVSDAPSFFFGLMVRRLLCGGVGAPWPMTIDATAMRCPRHG